MAKRKQAGTEPSNEVLELKNRLEETEETLQAIRHYLVDAFVMSNASGTQVVVLSQADFPYRLMVEAMNEGAVTLIPDGTILYYNQRFGEMLEREPDQLIGAHFQDLIAPEDREAFMELLEKAGKNGTRGEFCLQVSEGRCIPFQLSIYQLSGNNADGISIIATDISERRQAEKKIRNLASALTKAEQVERHRISQILHDDLQQRLFAVKAQLSLLVSDKEDEIPSKILSALDQVQKDLSEIVSITRSLSVDLSPVVLHGEGLADAILWLASQMDEQFGLNVELAPGETFNQLEDHMRVLLFRAVRELLFNIVKHAGTKQAAIKLEQVDDCLRITVSDKGIGFDTDAVMSETKTAHGLLVIQDRLTLMGGKMDVTSKIGEGTRVVIEIPREGNPA